MGAVVGDGAMVKGPWNVVWVEVSAAEAERALATRTFEWARCRASVVLQPRRPSRPGRWLAVSLRPGTWDSLSRAAVPEAYDAQRHESKAAHRLATRFAGVLSTSDGLAVRRTALPSLEAAVVRIEDASAMVMG